MFNGRAEELDRKGYYFIFYKPDGSMIPDIWWIGRRSIGIEISGEYLEIAERQIKEGR